MAGQPAGGAATVSPFRYLSLTIAVLIGLSGCVTVTQDRFAEKASPDKAVENYTQLGLGYLQKGRPDWARDRLQKALEIKPEDPAANDAMGLVWQTEGELDLAEESFTKALRHDSRFTQARHHLGRLYMQTGEFDKAEKLLKKSANDRYYNARVQAYSDLGMTYYRLGNPALAIESYKESLRLAPYNVDALVNVSTLLFEQQQYDESQKYFDRFDRLAQKDQTEHSAHSLWLGIQLANINQNTSNAVRLASQLKKQFPQSREYRMYQASLAGAPQ
ncbi:MAG TPA: type IV pilus biogenesis/stability protein PilW [Oceanospirillales bacterium]|nr:type IV pilus biogenesis/stability protein PilW [Oceanospirillales bacterium]